jgi:hypothetical protein
MDPMILTNSDVEAFLNCRRAWGWGDVEGFNLPDKEVSAAALGTRVHGGILDGYYRDGSDPVAYHDKLCRDALTRMGDAGAPDWDFDQFYKDMVVGRNCVEAYMEWMEREGPDHGYTVEGVEEEIEALILDGRVLLRGKVDLRMVRDTDGSRRVSDLKTSGLQMTTVHHRLERSYQPVVYDWLLELNSGENVAAATFRIVKKVNKRSSGKPQVEEFSVPGALRARANRRKMIERIALEMLALRAKTDPSVFYISPSDACAWCDFRDPCRLADEDPLAARAMLDDLFTAGRHARYEEK